MPQCDIAFWNLNVTILAVTMFYLLIIFEVIWIWINNIWMRVWSAKAIVLLASSTCYAWSHIPANWCNITATKIQEFHSPKPKHKLLRQAVQDDKPYYISDNSKRIHQSCSSTTKVRHGSASVTSISPGVAANLSVREATPLKPLSNLNGWKLKIVN